MLRKIIVLFFIILVSNMTANASEDFSLYIKQLKLVLDKAWNAPVYKANYTSDVYFKIKQDGTIEDVKLYKTSGISQLDKKAVAAVKSIKQTNPLPKYYTSENIEVVAGLSSYIRKDLRNPNIKAKNRNKEQISELPLSTRFVKIKKVIYSENFSSSSNYQPKMKNLVLNLDIQRAKKGY